MFNKIPLDEPELSELEAQRYIAMQIASENYWTDIYGSDEYIKGVEVDTLQEVIQVYEHWNEVIGYRYAYKPAPVWEFLKSFEMFYNWEDLGDDEGTSQIADYIRLAHNISTFTIYEVTGDTAKIERVLNGKECLYSKDEFNFNGIVYTVCIDDEKLLTALSLVADVKAVFEHKG